MNPSLYHPILLLIIFPLLLAGSQPSLASDSIAPYKAVYLFCYSNSVRSNIPVLISNDSVFIPVCRIFSLLKIFYTYDKTASVLKGYAGNPDSSLEININGKYGFYNSNHVVLNDNDAIQDNSEIFINPLFLDKLLDIHFNIIDISYSIILETSKPLPVDELSRRKSENRDSRTKDISNAFFLFEGNRSWINGASADYQLGYLRSGLLSNYNFLINTGFELLGGDFQIGLRGSCNQSLTSLTRSYNYRWRYFVCDNPWLTQVVAGNLSNTSMRQSSLPRVNMTGFQISNELPWSNPVFDYFSIDRYIKPGWSAEIYSNGIRLDPAASDPGPVSHFTYPAGYGTTTITAKYFGPDGEYSEYEEFVSVPPDFVTPGKAYYSLSAGRETFSNRLAFDGRMSAGITSFVTNSFCLQKQSGLNAWELFNKLSIRLPAAVTASFEASPNNYYRASAASVFGRNSGLGVNYTIYDKATRFNTRGALSGLDLYGSYNNRFALPFNLNFRLQRTRLSDYYMDSFWANLYMPLPIQKLLPSKYLFGLSSFNLRAMYSGNISGQSSVVINHQLTTALSFCHSGSAGSLLGISGFCLSADFDMSKARLVKSEFFLDQKILRDSYLRASVSRDFARLSFNAYIGLVINLSAIKSVTSAQMQQGYGLISQSFEGSAGYDHRGRGLYANNMDFISSVGFASASVRFFLDRNNNGLRDETEMYLNDVDYDVPGGLPVRNSKGCTDFVCCLAPYAKYSVLVNTASFQNPLIVPKLKQFSFIAGPNTCRIIDIPCYTASVIEGSVIIDEPLNKPFSLTLHITSTDSSFSATTTTYSDGSFYYMGLPPGEYRINTDDKELLLLGLKNKSPLPVINIMNTAKGDSRNSVTLYLTRNR